MMKVVKRVLRWSKEINLFVNPENPNEECEEEKRIQLIATRIYMLTLTVTLLVLVLYTSVIPRSVSIAIVHPSLNVFQQLEQKYSSTLACVCQQTSISYSDFVTIVPKYHQVIVFFRSFDFQLIQGYS